MRSTIRGTLRPVLAVALVGFVSAGYVHSDPAGVSHPGCLPANGNAPAPFNQSCPGLPMSDVYDWQSDINPFNTQQITEGLERFIEESGWDVSEFVAPSLGASREDGEPADGFYGREDPDSMGGSKTELTYKFSSFQSSSVTKDIDGLNADIQREAFSMYLAMEQDNYDNYLANEDASSLGGDLGEEFEQALRDAFDNHRVANDVIHQGDAASAGSATPGDSLTDFNSELERKILDLRVTQEQAAYDAYATSNGYGVLEAADVEDAVSDISAFNTANKRTYKTSYISEQNDLLQQFVSDEGVSGNFAVNTNNFQDASSINTAIGNAAYSDWTAARQRDQDAYLRNYDLANEGLGGIEDAITDIGMWNAQAVTTARTVYLRDSGLTARGVTVTEFGNGAGFNYTANPTNGARAYGGDPPAFTVTPVYAAPSAFAFSPAYRWTDYALTKTHAHSKYALSTPSGFNVTAFEWPTHITKTAFIAMSVYHKHWYVQLEDRCQATCAGSANAITDRDTDQLSADRTCDADDVVCPSGNASPGYEEFQLIINALHDDEGVHPECPAADPCVVTPPPCFYVSTECVPTEVVDLQLDNSAQRLAARGTPVRSTDDLYIHEPLALEDVVQWKLVSNAIAHDSPKHWDFNDGIVMDEYTSPVDSRPYHKTCTFALTQRNYERYDDAIEYGFSIAESDLKKQEGDTQRGQNSANAPNHVYDVGVTKNKEMWQRSFGETVSPQLSNQCTSIFAGAWRNRPYLPAQTLDSKNYVFGTCMETCDAFAVLGDQLGAKIETYPAFLAASAAASASLGRLGISMPKTVAGRSQPRAALGAAYAGDRFGTGATLAVGGVALCALVAAAVLAAGGSVKHAKTYLEARTGSAEERLTLSAV